MRINSEDCYIEYKKGVYYLFVPKSKKEIKEEGEIIVEEGEIIVEEEIEVDPKYKIIGYYTDPLNALSKLVKIRQDKKYKLKQPYTELVKDLNKIKLLYKILHYASTFEYKIKDISFKLIPSLLTSLKPTKTTKLLSIKSLNILNKNLNIQKNIKKVYESINKE